MVRLYGRAPRGRRLQACAPFGDWMTATSVGALRCDQITAPCVFRRADERPSRAYVQRLQGLLTDIEGMIESPPIAPNMAGAAGSRTIICLSRANAVRRALSDPRWACRQ